MQRERLQLALERIRPEQWKLFEEFASAFLSTPYPALRTLASPAGDQGRDAELFSYGGKAHTVLQYSVTKRWKDKIRDTAQKISKNLPGVRRLIYVTNQQILSAADSLKQELLDEHGLVLDIHDIAWFLDRLSGSESQEAAAETLATKIVDPYLASKGVLEHTAPTLSETEYQAALTFLKLQWEDDTREKGLTRLSFQALVRAVLRNTNSESRMSRTEIHKQIMDMFPDHDKARIKCLTDSALKKLTKRYIRHWEKPDEFCLTYEEFQRVRERLAEVEVANISLDAEIQSRLSRYGKGLEQMEFFCTLVRSALDRYLFGRGEAFAAAITNDKLEELGRDELQNSVDYTIKLHAKNFKNNKEPLVSVIFSCIFELLTEPSVVVQNHLRSKADAYTLFAFLGRTTDVQTAVSKMFSHGEIWLDTTIVLPLFAERLISINRQRRFSQMLDVASQAGLELRITPGVIEEVERHINRCQTYLHTHHSQWTGSVPFLADAYLRSGRSPCGFGSWIDNNFMGPERPEDDIADFLKEFFAIGRKSLEEEVMKADAEIRAVIQEAWYSAHAKRRDVDSGRLDRLVRHDVENYLGVVELRRRESAAALGYSAWWLTLDRSAGDVDNEIRAKLENRAPTTPVMSADFLVNYLSIGPIRSRVSRDAERSLPVALDMGSFAELPSDLLNEAERIRQEAGDSPEYIVRRRVRDCLDSAKRRPGQMSKEGIQTVLDAITPDTTWHQSVPNGS